jgi:hypothetical protein
LQDYERQETLEGLVPLARVMLRYSEDDIEFESAFLSRVRFAPEMEVERFANRNIVCVATPLKAQETRLQRGVAAAVILFATAHDLRVCEDHLDNIKKLAFAVERTGCQSLLP